VKLEPAQIPARDVLPGDRVMVEGEFASVHAARCYDGWVSIAVPGMDLRYAANDPVWVKR
jgi:hypothetical protein